MIRTLEHWFQMVVAPPGLADAINGMMRLRGYYTPRQDELGQILVSSMFVMHSQFPGTLGRVWIVFYLSYLYYIEF